MCVCLCVCVWSRGETQSDPGQRENFSGLMFHDNGPRFRQGESEPPPPNAWNTHAQVFPSAPPLFHPLFPLSPRKCCFLPLFPLFPPLPFPPTLCRFYLPVFSPFLFFLPPTSHWKSNYVVLNHSCSLSGLHNWWKQQRQALEPLEDKHRHSSSLLFCPILLSLASSPMFSSAIISLLSLTINETEICHWPYNISGHSNLWNSAYQVQYPISISSPIACVYLSTTANSGWKWCCDK